MVGAEHIAFEVTDYNMHPRQPFIDQFGRRDFGDMVVAFGQYPERGESIGMQGLLGSNGLLGKSLGGDLIYPADRFHGDKTRLPAVVFTCDQDSRLAFCAAAPLARTFAADISVVNTALVGG